MGQETNIMMCESCYEKNDEGAIFCHKCGNELITGEEKERIKNMKKLELNIMNSEILSDKMFKDLKYHWYDSIPWAFLFSFAIVMTIFALFLVFVIVIS